MTPRRAFPRPLAGALPGVLERVLPDTLLARAAVSWERAVGAEIASHSEPVSERQGVVTVACDSSIWAHELTLMHDELVAALRRELPGEELSGLRFQTAAR